MKDFRNFGGLNNVRKASNVSVIDLSPDSCLIAMEVIGVPGKRESWCEFFKMSCLESSAAPDILYTRIDINELITLPL